VLLGLGITAACSFSEGPDWPPPSDAAAVRGSDAGDVAPRAEAAARASLAPLVDGTSAPPPDAGAQVGRVRPLAVIRFGAGPLDFEEALYDALHDVLRRRPQTAFDLVALMPEAGQIGRRTAAERLEQVFLSVTGMGLPVERVSLSAVTLPGLEITEVHVYPR
jgi:hypothetical protein